MYNNDKITSYLLDLQDQKLLTFHWHSILGDSGDVFPSIVANKGSQYFDDESQQPNHFLIA